MQLILLRKLRSIFPSKALEFVCVEGPCVSGAFLALVIFYLETGVYKLFIIYVCVSVNRSYQMQSILTYWYQSLFVLWLLNVCLFLFVSARVYKLQHGASCGPTLNVFVTTILR
jgi:hypothetical protein